MGRAKILMEKKYSNYTSLQIEISNLPDTSEENYNIPISDEMKFFSYVYFTKIDILSNIENNDVNGNDKNNVSSISIDSSNNTIKVSTNEDMIDYKAIITICLRK